MVEDLRRWGGRWVLPTHWWVASHLPLRVRRHYLHLAGARRVGNFSTPRTFDEKVNWRILHDRRDVIVEACDKERMKEAARRAVPSSDDLRIPETLWLGTDLVEAPRVWSRPDWVLKPNHGSGRVLAGPQDFSMVVATTQEWLSSKQAVQLGEWGYSRARRALLLEERIPTVGRAPKDYKFFVFSGKVRLIQVNANRHEGRSTASFFDGEWNQLPIRWRRTPPADESRPDALDQMVAVAERIAGGWDFLRVDLYWEDGVIWFGELTPYPGGGVIGWIPRDFDAQLGEWWDLDLSVARER